VIALTAEQHDAVSRIMARAIARAATALGEMIAEPVRLSLPAADVMDRHGAAERLAAEAADGSVVAIRQRFSGRFSGEILLIFPEAGSLELVRTILLDAVPLDMFSELESCALVEVGNVVLNACIGSIAAELDDSLRGALPQFVAGPGRTVLGIGDAQAERGRQDVVLFLHVDFALENRPLNGFVAFVMEVDSARSFRQRIEAHLLRVPS